MSLFFVHRRQNGLILKDGYALKKCLFAEAGQIQNGA
jgi:hypothetical protein